MQLETKQIDHVATLERLIAEKNKEIVQNWLDKVVESYENDRDRELMNAKN